MKVTYDPAADAAYIYLTGNPTDVADTYPCEIEEFKGDIYFDVDKDGAVVGIEVVGASKVLQKTLLQSAISPIAKK